LLPSPGDAADFHCLVTQKGEPATGRLTLESTFDAADPVAWLEWASLERSANYWLVEPGSGGNVLTVHIVTRGQMNLAYFDFKSEE
jgi:hypothetical protein